MLINEILAEYGSSDIAAVLADAKDRLSKVVSATVSVHDYINQVSVSFRLYADDTAPCRLDFEIIPDPSANRDATVRKFEKKIISAATSLMARSMGRDPSGRLPRMPSYSEAKGLIKARPIGPRAIATLTNPNSWKLVEMVYGNMRWKGGAPSTLPRSVSPSGPAGTAG